jgi:hypothetical protein
MLTQGLLRAGLDRRAHLGWFTRLHGLRCIAWLNMLVFLGYALTVPIQALAQGIGKSLAPSSTPKFKPPVTHLPVKLYPPASAHCLIPLPDGTLVAPVSKPSLASLSLLDGLVASIAI